jgi:hypothetical protein
MNYSLPLVTLCGVGVLYIFLSHTKTQKPKPVDTSNWTIKEWRLQVLLSIMILENPTILKNVNKESNTFKYFVEIRKNLNDDIKRKEIIKELINKNLLIK